MCIRDRAHVDAAAQTNLAGDLHAVDVIEFQMLLRNLVFHGSGELLFHLFGRPGAVEQEGAAVFDAFQNVIADDIAGVMASHEIGNVDQVLGLDGRLAETQVRNCDAAGLLGVIVEVALGIHIGVVADDLDRVLVGADRTIRTQTEELAAEAAFRRSVDLFGDIDGIEGDIVFDTNGKVVFGLCGVHILEHAVDHGGREFLGA